MRRWYIIKVFQSDGRDKFLNDKGEEVFGTKQAVPFPTPEEAWAWLNELTLKGDFEIKQIWRKP